MQRKLRPYFVVVGLCLLMSLLLLYSLIQAVRAIFLNNGDALIVPRAERAYAPDVVSGWISLSFLLFLTVYLCRPVWRASLRLCCACSLCRFFSRSRDQASDKESESPLVPRRHGSISQPTMSAAASTELSALSSNRVPRGVCRESGSAPGSRRNSISGSASKMVVFTDDPSCRPLAQQWLKPPPGARNSSSGPAALSPSSIGDADSRLVGASLASGSEAVAVTVDETESTDDALDAAGPAPASGHDNESVSADGLPGAVAE